MTAITSKNLNEKLLEALSEVTPKETGRYHIYGLLEQEGLAAANFNQDIHHGQKRGVGPNGQETIMISAECFGASLFHRRHFVEMVSGTGKNSALELLNNLKEANASLRAGAHMGSAKEYNGTSTKALRIMPLYAIKKDLIEEINYRLGIQSGEKGKNADGAAKNMYPQEQFLYKSAKFVFHIVLDLEDFVPNKCAMLFSIAHKTKVKTDEEAAEVYKAFKEHLESEYFVSDGKVEYEKAVALVKDKLENYLHQVHKRYHPTFIATVVGEKICRRAAEEVEGVINPIKALFD